MRGRRIPRPANLSDRKLPRRGKPDTPSPGVCSRCGKVAESRYICNQCKSVLTVAARRKNAKDPVKLAERRKYNRDWMRRYRAKSG